MQTLTTTVYTAGIRAGGQLVFKAVVIIAVCLLQSPEDPGAADSRHADPRVTRPRSRSKRRMPTA